MSHHRFRAAVATLTAALVLSGLHAPPGDAEAAAKKQVRIIKPAQVGKAKIGMTVKEAMATGQFNKNVPNPPCGPIRLQPKKPFRYAYVVGVRHGKIIAMDVTRPRPHTPAGLRVGSTYRQVKKVYGARLSQPTEVGYGQWGAYVGRGKGAERRWIGFLFGEAFVDERPVRGRDKVTLIGVTKGERPPLMLDGC